MIPDKSAKDLWHQSKQNRFTHSGCSSRLRLWKRPWPCPFPFVQYLLSGSGWLLGPGHDHELIFGFALALVAGYTLGPSVGEFRSPVSALAVCLPVLGAGAKQPPIPAIESRFLPAAGTLRGTQISGGQELAQQGGRHAGSSGTAGIGRVEPETSLERHNRPWGNVYLIQHGALRLFHY